MADLDFNPILLDKRALLHGRDFGAAAFLWSLTGPLREGSDVRQTPIEPIPFQVGRRADLSFTIAKSTVSGVHAEFVIEDGGIFIHDLASTNGTFVNGERVVGKALVAEGDLIQFADVPFRLGRAQPNRDSRTICEDVCDHALALVQFERLMSDKAVIPHYQPIVDMQTRDIVAYEVLARSRILGLETPLEMFRAATQLRLEVELSRMMQFEGVQQSSSFAESPHLFLNTHPAELADPRFFNSLSDLRRLAPTQRLTLEIHEAAATEVAAMRSLRDHLDSLDMRLAFDDFGVGQARVAELAEIRPDCLKFDRRMIQGIDGDNRQRRRVVGQLVQMALDLGIVPLAECVETEAESAVCAELGFQLGQGFLYGRPVPCGREVCRSLPHAT